MKIATDLEQSKKLVELGIDASTSDMLYVWDWVNEKYSLELISIFIGEDEEGVEHKVIPAWSLSKLMDILPIQFDWELKTYKFKMQTDFYSSGEKYYDLGYQGAYGWLEHEDDTELVDACYNLIIKLQERELL